MHIELIQLKDYSWENTCIYFDKKYQMLNCFANLSEITSILYQMYLCSNMVNTLNNFDMEWNIAVSIAEVENSDIDTVDLRVYFVATNLPLKHCTMLNYSNFGPFRLV
jgi:hypothetical protein